MGEMDAARGMRLKGCGMRDEILGRRRMDDLGVMTLEW
jgi:hypothetical protein